MPSGLAFCTGAGGPNVGLVLVTAHTLPIKLALQAPINHFFSPSLLIKTPSSI